MTFPAGDPDFDEFRREQRRAQRADLLRGALTCVVMLFSLAGGALVAYGAALGSVEQKEERLARYEAGDIVVLPRGESVYDTSPSIGLVVILGLLTAVALFALGNRLFVKDPTYARGLARGLGGVLEGFRPSTWQGWVRIVVAVVGLALLVAGSIGALVHNLTGTFTIIVIANEASTVEVLDGERSEQTRDLEAGEHVAFTTRRGEKTVRSTPQSGPSYTVTVDGSPRERILVATSESQCFTRTDVLQLRRPNVLGTALEPATVSRLTEKTLSLSRSDYLSFDDIPRRRYDDVSIRVIAANPCEGAERRGGPL